MIFYQTECLECLKTNYLIDVALWLAFKKISFYKKDDDLLLQRQIYKCLYDRVVNVLF